MKQLAFAAVAGLLATACGTSSAPPSEVMTEHEAIQLALESEPSVGQLADQGYTEGDGLTAWREPGFTQRYTAENFNSVLGDRFGA